MFREQRMGYHGLLVPRVIFNIGLIMKSNETFVQSNFLLRSMSGSCFDLDENPYLKNTQAAGLPRDKFRVNRDDPLVIRAGIST